MLKGKYRHIFMHCVLRHRYLFDNWLVLSRAMTAAASYPREAEANALVAIHASTRQE